MPKTKKKAYLVLEDGTAFCGISCGVDGESFGEVVFNTSMMGYQEILTDPSYAGQMVAMTYPLIGNYGVTSSDIESRKPFLSAFIMKECSQVASNYRSEQSLRDYFQANNIMAIEGIDTRKLTRHIRIAGSMKAVLSTKESNLKKLHQKAKKSKGLLGVDLVKEVTIQEPKVWSSQGKRKIVVLDFGVKYNILRILASKGAKVISVPAHTSFQEIASYKPDGIMLSNGPGDPAAVKYAIETVKQLIGKYPIFGICLGHQILGLALGGKTKKMKFGHHGGNQPIQDKKTGKVAIAAENHGFCVDLKSLSKDIEQTHVNLNDNCLEGLQHKKWPIFSVQFHPEASPGPHDASYLFDRFIEMIDKNKSKKAKVPSKK